MSKAEIKVLIADDHPMIREGLKTILGFEEGISVVGEAVDGEQALMLMSTCHPDVVLLDCNMPIKHGLEVLQNIKACYSGVKTIMLTVETDRKMMHIAIQNGTDGYMLKDSAGKEIVSAIKKVYLGEKYLDESLLSFLFSHLQMQDEKVQNLLDLLSKRELEVLIQISQGFNNKQIGEVLYLSEKTVKNYATNLFKKLDVCDRVQATIFALQNNAKEYYYVRYQNEKGL